MKCDLRYVVAALLVLSFWVQPAAAGWSKDPMVNNPVCTTGADQHTPQIVGDGAGGSFVVWREDVSETDYDIYAQRLGPAGEPLWADGGVAVCSAPGYQYNPWILGDGTGRAIIVWTDERAGSDIYAQRIDADGNALWIAGGVPVCDDSAQQNNPRLATDKYGGAIIAWQDRRAGSTTDIYAQRIGRYGTAAWAEDGIPVCAAEGSQTWPVIIADGSGGAVVAWQDHQLDTYDIRAQQLDSSGNLQWDAGGVVICGEEPGDQAFPRIAGDGSGGAVIAWHDTRNGELYDFYAQRVDSAGSVLWATDGEAVRTAPGSGNWLTLLGDGSGGATIAWNDKRSGGADIYAQRVDGSGSMLWMANGEAVCVASYDQTYVRMCDDGSGGVLICWSDYRSAPDADVYAQRLDAGGNAHWGADGELVFGAEGEQASMGMLGLGTSGAVIVCRDQRSGADYDVYAQWVDGQGRVGGYTGSTVDGRFGCVPDSGTVPFATTMSLRLTNLYDGQIRRISGQINVRLANNSTITRWRAGYTNLTPYEAYNTSWSQNIPAVSSVVGINNFTLKAVDVTPAPYNQPPYPSSGDVDLENCLLTAIVP